MFISVFNYICLMGCSPPEMPRCWPVGGLGKLFTFCLQDRNIMNNAVIKKLVVDLNFGDINITLKYREIILTIARSRTR